MISITLHSGGTIWISPDHVESIRRDRSGYWVLTLTSGKEVLAEVVPESLKSRMEESKMESK